MKSALIDGSRYGWRGALVLPAEYFEVEIPGGKIKHWNGSSWVSKTMKTWSGSAWVPGLLKYWNGSVWVLSND